MRAIAAMWNAEMNDQELLLRLARASDSIPIEPGPEMTWEPLRRAIPTSWLAGYTLNGSANSPTAGAVWFYKHGITRKTIGLSEDGCAYVGGRPTSVWEAVEYVYADIEAMGYTRDTPYTHDLIAEFVSPRTDGWSVVHSAPFRYTD